MGVRAGTALEGSALKHGSQKLGINPLSVIFDRECGVWPIERHGELDGEVAAGVIVGVFQQIVDDLFDERGVHGNDDELLGYGDGDQCIRKPPAEPLDGLGYHFLHRLLRLFHVGHAAFVLDAGDGQQIFYHVQKPVRV